MARPGRTARTRAKVNRKIMRLSHELETPQGVQGRLNKEPAVGICQVRRRRNGNSGRSRR